MNPKNNYFLFGKTKNCEAAAEDFFNDKIANEIREEESILQKKM
jgi:hypothetical protein